MSTEKGGNVVPLFTVNPFTGEPIAAAQPKEKIRQKSERTIVIVDDVKAVEYLHTNRPHPRLLYVAPGMPVEDYEYDTILIAQDFYQELLSDDSPRQPGLAHWWNKEIHGRLKGTVVVL